MYRASSNKVLTKPRPTPLLHLSNTHLSQTQKSRSPFTGVGSIIHFTSLNPLTSHISYLKSTKALLDENHLLDAHERITVRLYRGYAIEIRPGWDRGCIKGELLETCAH